MRWKMVKKGNVWKRRPELDVDDWVCIIFIMGVVFIMLLGAIIRRM